MGAIESDITREDLRYILNNPWEVSKLEWRIADENNRNAMFTYIQELLEKAEEDGYSKIYRTATHQPIAILGSYKISEKNYTTFLICSHHYEEHVMELTFEMRNTLKEKATELEEATLGLLSVSKHPGLFSWLRFLGFQHIPEGDKGDWRYFEFVSRKKVRST